MTTRNGFVRSARASGLCSTMLLLSACQTAPSPMPDGMAGYAAIARPPVQDDERAYRLQVGDVVSVQVFGEPDLSADTLIVDTGGTISLALIGEVTAAGRSASVLAQDVARAYGARYLRQPQVTVAVKQTQSAMVTVEGEVTEPGSYPYQRGDTLLMALARAKSPTNVAALDEVVVFRTIDGDRYGGRFDVSAIRDGRMPDLTLEAGDIVVVGHSARRAALRGFFRATPILGAFAPL